MITPDDNGYARVKRWREKNRARYNLYQRNYRKGLRANPEYGKATHEVEVHLPEALPKKSTIEELRELVKTVENEPTMPATKPRVFRSETGAVITEKQYLEREEEKRLAREKGFEIDEYAQ